jgi:hypothetical protein
VHAELLAIPNASGWAEYYQAYQKALRLLAVHRWALGIASSAGHVHHLAIPDISGQVSGASWAIYTQPSSDTLLISLPLFAQLLRREPIRITSNRYIFLVANGSVPTAGQVKSSLGDLAGMVRIFTSTIEDELNRDQWKGPLVGAYVLGATDWYSEMEEQLSATKAPISVVRATAEALAVRGDIGLEDRLLVGGALVLCGYRAEIAVQRLVEILGHNAWLYGSTAIERAKASSWSAEAIEYCQKVRDAIELVFEDYIVVPGDILGRIVREKYKASFERLWPTIRAANPQIEDPNKIRAGQHIRLPRF